MGHVSKEGYERKAAYAARKSAKNAKIETLTEQQHEALSWLCEVRHEIHTGQKHFFCSESGDHEHLWNYIDGGINSKLSLANLPGIEFKYNELDVWTDSIIGYDEEGFVEEFGAEYELDENSDTQDVLIAAEDRMNSEVCRFNAAIEKYLSNIDELHGTEYSPTGAARLF